MPRCTAAVLAAVLLAAGCSSGGDAAPDLGGTLFAELDLDAAVGGDAALYDLAPGPGSADGAKGAGGAGGHGAAPVALLGNDDGAWLVALPPTGYGTVTGGRPATDVRPLPAVAPGSRLALAPDGTALVAGVDLIAVPPGPGAPTAVPLGAGALPAAVLLDGGTLFVADGATLTAVDATTGRVTATVDAPATALARYPGGDLAALVAVPRTGGGTGAALARYTTDLRPVGEPVELVAERGSTAAALQVTSDGTAVATVHLGAARSVGRLVTVAGGRVRAAVDLEGAGDSALDLVLSPDGRYARVPVADLSYPAELVTVDLAAGERVGAVSLCEGAGVLGAAAPRGATGVVVTGVCIDGDGPQATAFLVE